MMKFHTSIYLKILQKIYHPIQIKEVDSYYRYYRRCLENIFPEKRHGRLRFRLNFQEKIMSEAPNTSKGRFQ